MIPTTRRFMHALVVAALAVAACSDATPAITAPDPADSARVSASVQWNERAVALVVARPPAGNAQAAVSRHLTYLSLAQYRAATAAAAASSGSARAPSVVAAVAGASAAVLAAFYPGDAAALEAQLRADVAAETLGPRVDVAAGESLGRGIGAAVLAEAERDAYNVASVGTPPAGPTSWKSTTAPIVRSLHGTRPFFLRAADQLRPPAPPVVGSPRFAEALAEVRRIADGRTAGQIATAQAWNTASGPYTAGALNLMVDTLLRARRTPEAEAARILAFANAAAFDAQIACWDAKLAYWYPRPSHVDPAITMAIALPNHPSYPSGHSCITAAIMGVVAEAYPTERARLDAVVDSAGVSRIYGGIHYRFDIEAGRDIGRAAAALALRGTLR